jgi:hypothetical protein
MTIQRVKCAICDNRVLPATAQANEGLCAQCVKIPPAERRIAAAVHAETHPLDRAIELYSSLIDSLAKESRYPYFGGIADPEFQAVRFYGFDTVSSSFDYDEATEIGSEGADEIEHYLHAADSGYSLLLPTATKLRSISPTLNLIGKTVFLGSWGMGPGEIGWLIRYLNDRPTFLRYLTGSGITEQEVDAFNEAYAKDLNQAVR